MAGHPPSEPLLGRERELAALRAAHEQAGSDSTAVVVVAGETGIGKTRLVREFREQCPPPVLAGSCVPVAGESLPLAPVVGALRGLSRSLSEEDRDRLFGQAPPELARLLPAGGPPDDREPLEPSPDREASSSGQVRLFESLLSLVEELSTDRALVWATEDLHWADRSTLDLLAFLAANARQERLLLLMTVRTDDLARGHPLREWLAELGRIAGVTRLDLARLTKEQTARQMRALAGDEADRLDPTLVDVVFARSAGNPLYTELLAPTQAEDDESADGGVGMALAAMPESLHDLVAARIGRLPEATYRLLEVAAVLGKEATPDLIGKVAELPLDTVEQGLQPAVASGLVTAAAGCYGFAHPIFREVVEDDLMPARRRTLHAGAAESLREWHSEDPAERFSLAGQVAHHWECAQEPDLAFTAAVEAGLAAQHMLAFADADRYLDRAVTLRRERGSAMQSPIDDIELLTRASQTAHLVGDGPRALRLVDRAIELCTDEPRRADLLERRGTYCFNAGLGEEGEQAYLAALELLPDEASATRARMYAGLGLLAMSWTRMEQAEEHCRRAIEIAREVGARREEGRALNALGVVYAYRGELDEGIGHSRRAVELVDELADPDDLAMAYIDLSHVLGVAARYDEAVEACRAGYQAMRRVGLVRQDGSFLQANAAESLIKAGRLDEAAGLLEDAQAQLSIGLRAFPVLAVSARLAVARGDLDAAADWVGRATALLDEFGAPDPWRREVAEIMAELHLWQGAPDEAYAVALDGLQLAESSDEQRFSGSLVGLAARAVADLAESPGSDSSAGEPGELASALVDRVADFDPNPLDADRLVLPEAQVLALHGRAELGRLAGGPGAADSWADTAAAWERLGQPLRAAYSWWREGEALILAKEPGNRPVAAVRRAHATAVRVGAQGLAAEVEQLARWGRVDLLEGAGVELPEQRQADLGLTPRELEILASLLAGRTNREIADALFISVKTVSVHVSNILRKLEVQSREEAARVAHRVGITAS